MTRLFRFMNWPLRAKMGLLLVAASTLPLGVAAYIDIREARRRMVADTAALLTARGDHLSTELDDFNRSRQRAVDKISRLPDIVAVARAGPDELHRLEPSILATLAVQSASDPGIRGVGILDPTGRVKVATEPLLSGLDLSVRSPVRQALSGASVTSTIHLAESQAGLEPTIAYLAPVHSTDRKVIGVVALWVRAAYLWKIVSQSNALAGPGSFAVVLDRLGIRIAHTYSDEIVFHPAGKLDPALIDALEAERHFGSRTRELLEGVRAFPEQFDRARSESPDKGVFHGYAPVNKAWTYGVARGLETAPWTVFYMIPEESISDPIAKMTRVRTAFAGVMILLALLAGTLFAVVILKPIQSLSKATTSLATGDLTARVDAGREDELGRLGSSFNTMAGRIEGQAAALKEAARDLADQNRRLLEASRLKSEFLANMSHELRTPLNAIIGFSEVMYDGRVGPVSTEHKEYLGDILTSSRHLLRLINDVLDLSNIEAGRSEFRPEPVQMASLVDEVISIVRTPASSKRIRIEAAVDPEVPEVVADPAKLKQVLYNYVSNALKFTPEEGRVTIRVRPEGPERFRLEVEDTGIGIKAEDVNRLFVEFQQLDASSAKKYPGTGLGLSLTKRIVEAQGGQVGVESRPGQGSVFYAVLPRVAASALTK